MTALYFFLILSLLILVHEGGHFLSAKKAGIKVEEFGFGIPPRIWGKKIGETIYSINLLPFGGFVRLWGEESQVKKDRKNSFSAKGKKTRIGILLAGVVMNFLLGIVLFGLVYSFLGIPEKIDKVLVVAVMPDSPAEKSGLKENDQIILANDQQINSNEDFINLVNENLDKTIILTIDRDLNPCQDNQERKPELREENFWFCQDNQLMVQLAVRSNPPKGEGATGVIISQTQNRFYPFYKMIPKAIYNGVQEAFFWTKQMAVVLVQILVKIFSGQGISEEIAGPIGIYQATGEVSRSGFLALVHFTGILSINLAIFNLIPFPALDGGRVVFVLAEKLIGQEKREKIESWANQIGMILLIGLLVLITINDLKRPIG
ncbi:MAG: M50 family metallopeptidase [Candidatus Shapirobacteria bacterium]|nr:M50 family metallopeptidase [Candidatus Shapirobacteria bacterium]